MAPIYDSDVASDRFEKESWNTYELWEKIEVRLRRHRRAMIAGTVALYLIISSVPIVLDHWPKWKSLVATRRLALVINRLKLRAATQNQAFRIRFQKSGILSYQIEKLMSCQDSRPDHEITERGSLLSESQLERYRLLSRVEGEQFGIPGLLDQFCYDSKKGSESADHGESTVGFAVIPANDLTSLRSNRIALLVLSEASAQPEFSMVDLF